MDTHLCRKFLPKISILNSNVGKLKTGSIVHQRTHKTHKLNIYMQTKLEKKACFRFVPKMFYTIRYQLVKQTDTYDAQYSYGFRCVLVCSDPNSLLKVKQFEVIINVLGFLCCLLDNQLLTWVWVYKKAMQCII